MYVPYAEVGASVDFNEEITALESDGFPAWAPIAAFLAFLFGTGLLLWIIALFCRPSLGSATNTTANNEQGPAILEKGDSRGLETETLENIAPAKRFKDVQSEHAKILPSQVESPVNCVVCLDVFEDNSTVRALPCHHIFQSNCINGWLLNRHATCPLCIARYIPDLALPTIPPRAQPCPEHRRAVPAPTSDNEDRRSLG
ncbi:hypothetical protein B0I37DRAFT_244147 [Chaetomium sp. MPI-CAGE-AT-0009]|nr:hypothetical protein B0I37DRAFT_244147 [Chaetomium sp. MPI-CAGE-AT-0009]